MGAFRTIIGCNFEQFETGSFEPNRYLVLDTQEEKSVTASATLAQQPLQNGDTMTDHMYRDPTKFHISGSFSLNGKNWNDDSYNFMEKGDRLTNVQEVFEYIKNNGILCRLTTIDEDDLSKLTTQGDIRTRFKIRNNMALQSITWKEKQNSVSYSFDFVEVIMVEKQLYEELSEEERNELGLPHVSSPVGSSLGTILADTGQLHQAVIESLYRGGYIDDDFLRALVETGEIIKNLAILTAIIVVAVNVAVISVAAVVGLAYIGATIGATALLVPVGTVVAAVVVVVAAIVCFIKGLIDRKKEEEKRRKAFKLINGSPDADAERLVNLLEDIEKRVNQVKTGLTIYNINGNYRQTVTLNIGGEYYLIEFDKNNADENEVWGAVVTDMEGNPLNTVRHSWCPVSSISDLNRNVNLWFKDKSLNYEVYLVNPSLSEEYNPDFEALENARANLEGYSIWVSSGDITKHVNAVYSAIDNAITQEGFI